jgi:hypothetical protein
VSEVKHYVIVGSGDAPEEVVSGGLGDLPKNSMFYVPWLGGLSTKPTDGMMKVYDYLVDHGLDFVLFAKDRGAVHPALVDAASDVWESGSYSPDRSFDNVPPESTALVLWDDNDVAGTESLICDYFDRGHPLCDLTNGLTPIEVESVATEPTPPPKDDEIEPLTDDDLASMPTGVRKQLERSLGEVPDGVIEAEETNIASVSHLRVVDNDDDGGMDEMLATVVLILPTGRVFTTTVTLSQAVEMFDLPDAE